MPHSSSPLSAGVPVRAVDFPPAQFVTDQTGQSDLTSTSYETGTPEVAVRIQAPTSGRIAVCLSAGVRNNTSSNQDRVFVSFRVLEGDPADGNLVHADEVKFGRSNYAYQDADDSFEYGGHLSLVGGLTPGVFYFVQVRHRVTIGSGTADISNRQLLVFPAP